MITQVDFTNGIKMDEVAISLDDLTEQFLLKNKLTAAAILYEHGSLNKGEYDDFLTTIYKW